MLCYVGVFFFSFFLSSFFFSIAGQLFGGFRFFFFWLLFIFKLLNMIFVADVLLFLFPNFMQH